MQSRGSLPLVFLVKTHVRASYLALYAYHWLPRDTLRALLISVELDS